MATPTITVGYENGTSVILQQGESESETVIIWGFILFTFIWLIAIALLVTLVLAFVLQRNCKNRSTVNAISNEAIGKIIVEADAELQANPADNRTSPGSSSSSSPATLCRALILIPVLAAMFGMTLSILTQTSCEFVEFADPDFGPDPLSIGIWSVAFPYLDDSFGGDGKCYYHVRNSDILEVMNYEPDRYIKIARAGACLGTMFGGLGMLALFYYCCTTSAASPMTIAKGAMVSKVLTALFVFAAVFQALTLAVHGTEPCANNGNCQIGYGSLSSFTAVYFWLLASLGVHLVRFRTS